MNLSSQIDTLSAILGRLGIEVRLEQLDGGQGGMCRMRNRTILFLDSKASVEEQANACLDALALHPDRDQVFMPPVIRQALEAKLG